MKLSRTRKSIKRNVKFFVVVCFPLQDELSTTTYWFAAYVKCSCRSSSSLTHHLNRHVPWFAMLVSAWVQHGGKISVFKTSNSNLQKWKMHTRLCETERKELLSGADWCYYIMTEQGGINYVNIYHTSEAALPTSCLTTVEIPADLPQYCAGWLEIPVSCPNTQCFFIFLEGDAVTYISSIFYHLYYHQNKQGLFIVFASFPQDWSQPNLNTDDGPVSATKQINRPSAGVWRSDRKGE